MAKGGRGQSWHCFHATNCSSASFPSPPQVYGGPDLHSPRIAQLCNRRPPGSPMQVSSTGNEMTIRFMADRSINGRGFNASWQAVPGGERVKEGLPEAKLFLKLLDRWKRGARALSRPLLCDFFCDFFYVTSFVTSMMPRLPPQFSGPNSHIL